MTGWVFVSDCSVLRFVKERGGRVSRALVDDTLQVPPGGLTEKLDDLVARALLKREGEDYTLT